MELEQGINHIPAHVGHHVQEEFITFALIFHQRILLAIAAQAHRFPQRVHLLQVLAPEGVNLLKDEIAFRVAHQARAQAVDLPFLDVVGNPHLLGQESLDFRGVEVLNLLGSQVLDGADKFLYLVHHLLQIPFLRWQIGVHIGIHNVEHCPLGIFNHPLFQVFPFKDAAALGIDGPTLVIHHLVVFKNLLPNVVVIGFDFPLGPFERSGQHSRLDRHVLFHAEHLHQAGHPIAPKDPQQVIFQAQEKPSGTGVTLAACPPAQLVINPARFVAFRTDHMQATQLDHLFMFTVGESFVFPANLVVGFPQTLHHFIIGGGLFRGDRQQFFGF